MVSKSTSRRLVAYHEGGHGVIARVQGISVPYISLSKRYAATEPASWFARDLAVPELVAAIEADVRVALAGRVAQVRSHPDLPLVGDEGDIAFANDAVATIVLLLRGEPFPPPGTRVQFEGQRMAQLSKTLERLNAESAELVDRHWREIERVAQQLVQYDEIDGAELDRLIAEARRHH